MLKRMFVALAHQIPYTIPNFQDKVRVMRAARPKGRIMYGEQEVKFFPDLSAELLQGREYRVQLKHKGL